MKKRVYHKPLVSVIIVNWNGKHYLSDCLSSLDLQVYHPIEVLLVDNNSKDGSCEYVKKNFPKVTILKNEKNLGFAQANNIGYTHAKGKYILFLNNDTRVIKNFLSPLVTILENDKKVGIVQSKILLMDQPEKLDSVGAFFTNTGFLYHYGITQNDSKKFSKKIPLYSAKGACMLIPRYVIEKILVDSEIFDSRYFAYFEETDLCHRVWLAGYRVEFIPESVIYHKMGGTSDGIPSEFMQYHSFKNRVNSYIKNLSFSRLLKLLPIHLILLQFVAFSYLFTLKTGVFVAIQKSLVWNVLQLPNTLAKRKYIQEFIRMRPDIMFMPEITRNKGLRYYLWLLNYNMNGAFRNFKFVRMLKNE